MIGCVAADMGVTLLPRAVVERNNAGGAVRLHVIAAPWARVDTLFVRRRTTQPHSALRAFAACLTKSEAIAAA